MASGPSNFPSLTAITFIVKVKLFVSVFCSPGFTSRKYLIIIIFLFLFDAIIPSQVYYAGFVYSLCHFGAILLRPLFTPVYSFFLIRLFDDEEHNSLHEGALPYSVCRGSGEGNYYLSWPLGLP